MSTTIPIQNLYYLLSYAWDHFQAGEEVDISAESCPDLANLLGRVLAHGIEQLARRGFDQQYVETLEAVSSLRGRVLVAQSYRRMTQRAGRMLCEFDELSPDVLPNRILRSTCDRLLGNDQLTAENRHLVRRARSWLRDVRPVPLTNSAFSRVQFHRNNRAYRFLIHACRLVHQCLLPEEKDGTRRFRDILRDETIMSALFEQFVFNFARRHCRGATVSAMEIKWQADYEGDARQVVPGMITDVTIEWPQRKLILDCKFYRQAMVSRYDALRLRSGHLYQLHAYLTNKAVDPGWETAEGMLLYPANGYSFDHAFTLHGRHRIRAVTIDLQQNWPDIETNLQAILHAENSQPIQSA
jgi:5-methylcytosine-specific restriction enzyme subunit McrC